MELYWNSKLILHMTLRIFDMPSDEQSCTFAINHWLFIEGNQNYYTGGNSVTVHYRVVLLRRRYVRWYYDTIEFIYLNPMKERVLIIQIFINNIN